MHNGSEVWAKAPNPHAGLARYTMASEVATCDIVSHVTLTTIVT